MKLELYNINPDYSLSSYIGLTTYARLKEAGYVFMFMRRRHAIYESPNGFLRAVVRS